MIELTGTITCWKVHQFPNGFHKSWVVIGYLLDLGDDIGHGSSVYYDCVFIASCYIYIYAIYIQHCVHGVGILLIPEPLVGLTSRDKHKSCSQDLGCLRKMSLLMPVKSTDNSMEIYS